MAKETVILEIARGDSISALLEQGVVEPFTYTDGYTVYNIIGGTEVPAEFDRDAGTVTFGGRTMRINAFGFGHPERSSIRSRHDPQFVAREVFFGTDD